MPRAFVAVGSNVAPETNVRRALLLLAREVRLLGISTFYQTKPIDRPDQPPFCNGVVEIETELPPRELKHSLLHRIERELGRLRTEDKYAPRAIDLDLLLYDDLALETEGLLLPDPEIERRPFLAIPLAELAPELILPGKGVRMGEVAARLAGAEMRPLPEYSALLRKEVAHEPGKS